jgi:hypothetical protein
MVEYKAYKIPGYSIRMYCRGVSRAGQSVSPAWPDRFRAGADCRQDKDDEGSRGAWFGAGEGVGGSTGEKRRRAVDG